MRDQFLDGSKNRSAGEEFEEFEAFKEFENKGRRTTAASPYVGARASLRDPHS